MPTYLLSLVAAAAGMLFVSCGGDDECAQAFDRELECGERTDEQKDQMKSRRTKGIGNCKKYKEGQQMQARIRCSKKTSCEEFQSCKFAEKSKESLKGIDRSLSQNDASLAMGLCLGQLGTYKAVPVFKARCDEAIGQAFSKLDSEEDLSNARFRCIANAGEWREYSPALVKGCLSLASRHKAAIIKLRRDGQAIEDDCFSYKEILKALDRSDTESLCKQ